MKSLLLYFLQFVIFVRLCQQQQKKSLFKNSFLVRSKKKKLQLVFKEMTARRSNLFCMWSRLQGLRLDEKRKASLRRPWTAWQRVCQVCNCVKVDFLTFGDKDKNKDKELCSGFTSKKGFFCCHRLSCEGNDCLVSLPALASFLCDTLISPPAVSQLAVAERAEPPLISVPQAAVMSSVRLNDAARHPDQCDN